VPGPWYLVRPWFLVRPQSLVLGPWSLVLGVNETTAINNQPRVEPTGTDMRQQARRSRLPVRLTFAGTVFIVGGEIFCLVGPLRYERIVHVSCHTILLYAGIALVCVGAGLYWAERRRGAD